MYVPYNRHSFTHLRQVVEVQQNEGQFSQLFEVALSTSALRSCVQTIGLSFSQADLGVFRYSLETIQMLHAAHHLFAKVRAASACRAPTVAAVLPRSAG